jgi:Tfp pilus assembly protein PilF
MDVGVARGIKKPRYMRGFLIPPQNTTITIERIQLPTKESKMKERRTGILMAILLIMVGVFILKPSLEIAPSTVEITKPSKEDLLPGENEIKNVEITRDDDGNLYATVHYYFRGGMTTPKIRVLADSPAPNAGMYWMPEQTALIKKGDNTAKIEIIRPYEPTGEFTSKKITVSLVSGFGDSSPATTKKEIDYSISWITQLKYENDRELAKKTNDELYKESVDLIDRAENNITLNNAKFYLERILLKDPSYINAYPELARISMKTNWNQEGLKQAENYLNLGLVHKPDHADSHVLLGYVYTYQKKFDEARKEFESAANIGTPNLWLWSNWGELYKIQGDSEKAIEMYQKAVAGSRPFNTYDRARLDAYKNLFILLNKKDRTSQAEQLYVKRADEFANIPCLRSEYAAFKIYNHQDYEGALTESRKAMTNGCNTDESRQIIGLANYVGWMMAKEDRRAEYFAQAQLLFPASPKLLYTLAGDDQTAGVLDELEKEAISIDMRDGKNLNALSYALMENNVDAARRLIKHGAKLTEIVGEQNYPIAMTPIFYQHIEGVQLILDQGISLPSVKFRGESAIDYAEKSQNTEIIRLVKKIKT